MKTFLTQWKILLYCVLTMSIYACFDASQFDTSKLASNTNIKPSFALPIAKANLKLSDFLSEMKDTLEFDKADSLIRLKYKNDSIYSFSVADVYKAPVINAFNKNFNLSNVVFTNYMALRDVTISEMASQSETDPSIKTILNAATGSTVAAKIPAFGPATAGSFDYIFDKDFQSLTFASGTVYTTITNSLPFDMVAEMELINIVGGVKTVVGTMYFTGANTITAGSSKTLSMPLASKTITKNILCRLAKLTSAGTSTAVLLKGTDKFTVKVEIKDATILSGVAPFPGVKDSTEFVLTSTGERIESLKLASGKFKFNIVSNLSTDCNITLTLPGTTRNGLPVTIPPITVLKGGTTNYEYDLSGTLTKPTKNGTVFPLKYEAASLNTQAVSFKNTDNVTVNASLYQPTSTLPQLDFEYISGYFGQKSYPIPLDNINLNMSAFDNLDGGLIFTEPVLKVKITNNIGIPVNMKLNLTGKSSTSKTANVNPIDKNIINPTVIGNTSKDSIMPDVVNLLALPPKTISYSGSTTINPGNPGFNPALPNFVTKTGKVKIGISFDVPFKIKTDNLVIRDTSKISISANDIKQASSVAIQMDYINKIPFDLGVSLVFYDSKAKKIIQTITPTDKNNLLLSAAETTSGVVVAKTGTTLLNLTTDQINKFALADQIITVGVINTKGKIIELHANATLGIKLYLKTSLDLKL